MSHNLRVHWQTLARVWGEENPGHRRLIDDLLSEGMGPTTAALAAGNRDPSRRDPTWVTGCLAYATWADEERHSTVV